jgi:uncharacterized membrane protein YfcA
MGLDGTTLAFLCAAFAAAAALYSSVGHGGASAYLALMALVAAPPELMRPTALSLNVLVASLGAWRFVRAGRMDWGVFWPVTLAAVPMAWLGGSIALPGALYRPLLGVVLLLAALRLLVPDPAPGEPAPPSRVALAGAGGGIGLLAGLTGTGGGIFLSPLLIFLRWARATDTMGIAACFIVVNSLAGLAGNLAASRAAPPELPWLLAAALTGALIGTTAGVRLFTPAILRLTLAAVMAVAGVKLLAT